METKISHYIEKLFDGNLLLNNKTKTYKKLFYA